MVKLEKYQIDMEVRHGLKALDMHFHKNKVILAYLNEFDNRLWSKFLKIEHDGEISDEDAKKLVIETAKEVNTEWNNHREILPKDDCWMVHNSMIMLLSSIYDFPIKIVPKWE